MRVPITLLPLLVFILLIRTALSADQPLPQFTKTFRLDHFLKGNLHTHTLRSDGDAAPEAVIGWYRSHGYDFLALTDHDRAVKPGEFHALEDAHFQIVSSEELSFWTHRQGKAGKTVSMIPVHVNGFCMKSTVTPRVVDPVTKSAQTAVSAVLAQPGAVAQINHPYFYWALSADTIAPIQGASLLEIANEHPGVNNGGDATHVPIEELWDLLLSRGKLLYGTAGDDMHDLFRTPTDEPPRRPGKGWVQVAASQNNEASICQELKAGNFYFSTGVSLNVVEVSATTMSLEIHGVLEGDASDTERYETRFIGTGGKILSIQHTLFPVYGLQGGEGYVRAKVVDLTTGQSAWTQPVFSNGT